MHAYVQVAPALADSGWRVIIPYFRGYGPTRFRNPITPRSGQQAALGHDLLGLMDRLSVGRAILAGYDWGGRAACIVAALWPERVAGLVSITGYNIQNIATALRPGSPDAEYRYWYQWYFHTERGRAGLSANCRPFCRKLWELWSPNYRFDDSEYERTANPDFVDVSIHSYTDTAMGQHRVSSIRAHRGGTREMRLVFARRTHSSASGSQPIVTVPTIVLHGESDGVSPPQSSEGHDRFFAGSYQRRVVPLLDSFSRGSAETRQ